MNRKEHNLPDDSHKHLINMKKTLLNLAFLSLLAFVATDCSSDEEYNADTAISYYKPLEYDKMVSSIAITSNVSNRNYSWTYNFVYDAQNRIKEINGNTKFYENNIKQYCEGTVQTRYYYNNETLKVQYQYDIYIPKLDKNISSNAKYFGHFDKEDGKLTSFDSFDCEYSGFELTRAYTDYGTSFGLEYDRDQNIVKSYQIDSLGKAAENTIKTYEYSTKVNKTNIDFASFLGYNIIERNIPCNEFHPYELFHLGAFGMFGSRGKNLPKGEWEFDEQGYPVKFVSQQNRTYIIKYKE